jgi:hypothetical protein
METARTPGFVAWPEKLITQAEAFVLAGNWPVYAWVEPNDAYEVSLRCEKCNQSCGQLRHGGSAYNGSLDEMLSMVLRHMVMAHDVSLSGLRKKDGDDGN